jgi:hypothetical protein
MKAATRISKSTPPQRPKLLSQMRDDPRFLTLLAGVGGGALAQFEVRRMVGKGMDYDGGDLIETSHSHGWAEDERCEQQARRIWRIAEYLYERLVSEDDSDETTQFSDSL